MKPRLLSRGTAMPVKEYVTMLKTPALVLMEKGYNFTVCRKMAFQSVSI